MDFAFAVVDAVWREQSDLFDDDLTAEVTAVVVEAVEAETAFAADLLVDGMPALSLSDTGAYLEYIADQRLARLTNPDHGKVPQRRRQTVP
jgi:ribonucleoside-diphosphate reductase beta chain